MPQILPVLMPPDMGLLAFSPPPDAALPSLPAHLVDAGTSQYLHADEGVALSAAAGQPGTLGIFPDDLMPSGELHFESLAGGTTGSEWLRDDTGQRWLAKGDNGAPELQTAAEVIATTAYRWLGYPAPVAHISRYRHHRVVLLSDLGVGFTRERALESAAYRRLFIYVALLADTDRDNNPGIMRDSGLPVLYDCAGALGAKARGQPKTGGQPFSPAIGYFPAEAQAGRILAAYNRPSDPCHPWNRLVGPDIAAALAGLLRLDDTVINTIVARAHYTGAEDTLYMVTALRRRRDALLEGLSAWYERERWRRQNPIGPEQSPEWLRKHGIACREIGREAARLFATTRRQDRPSCQTLEEVLVWYRGHPGFSAALEGDLKFVEANRQAFAELFAQGVWPLDSVSFCGRCLSTVDYYREFLAPSSTPRQFGRAEYLDYLINNSFGARGLQAKPGHRSFIAHLRPELLPFFGHDRAGQLRNQGKDLGRRLQKNEYGFRHGMIRPGFFVPQGLPQLPATVERDFFRINYKSYHTPEDAVENVLRGVEQCTWFRLNPHLSRFQLLLPWRAKGAKELLAIARNRTNHWFDSTDSKFFVSVSSQRFDAIDDANGNLRINLRSSRAFKVPEGFSNSGEHEYGIPFVINPAEIISLELNFHGVQGPDIPGELMPRTEMKFYWNDDFTALRVAVTVPAFSENYDLHYVFDQRSRHYRRVRDPILSAVFP